MKGKILLKVFSRTLENNKIEVDEQFWENLNVDEDCNPILLEYTKEIHEGFGNYSYITHHWMFELDFVKNDVAYYKDLLVSPRFTEMLPKFGWEKVA